MKLACWSAGLLIAACTSSPTPEDDLKDLNARVTTSCAPIQANADASAAVACLNAALQTQTVALALGDHWEANASECIEHWSFFAVDGEVRIFESIGDCEDTDTTTVHEQSCPGPFSTDNTPNDLRIQATGCTITVGG